MLAKCQRICQVRGGRCPAVASHSGVLTALRVLQYSDGGLTARSRELKREAHRTPWPVPTGEVQAGGREWTSGYSMGTHGQGVDAEWSRVGWSRCACPAQELDESTCSHLRAYPCAFPLVQELDEKHAVDRHALWAPEEEAESIPPLNPGCVQNLFSL
jgi:hypothetical protein